jgi:hypothetical protein
MLTISSTLSQILLLSVTSLECRAREEGQTNILEMNILDTSIMRFGKVSSVGREGIS